MNPRAATVTALRRKLRRMWLGSGSISGIRAGGSGGRMRVASGFAAKGGAEGRASATVSAISAAEPAVGIFGLAPGGSGGQTGFALQAVGRALMYSVHVS